MAISRSWRYTTRQINGVRRRVKVRKRGKGYQVRIVGFINRVDRTARKRGYKRNKYYYSSTDAGPRKRAIRRG